MADRPDRKGFDVDAAKVTENISTDFHADPVTSVLSGANGELRGRQGSRAQTSDVAGPRWRSRGLARPSVRNARRSDALFQTSPDRP
ncbi:hypothetical protein BREVUG8_100463 [Brevundimonas sp. G8]|nr:hypothetical protein BREVUG8_100463 [Brevundimonas sp. G8]